eukprot:gnl/TRDRNA2_/TRDRNA2_134495_c0_seq2.p1 gnl/TRDRNA2_/TRDRNA2_134495_c0~~gnl/TRDRNA2_/TRDRNA2_134495_c0_seq2.p1  ORF type:complete len:376 (+),score=94.26 gnl/TRDRNA2_/TRDRNA2_134495_c0_seq2:145-1272(+)
MAPPATDDDRPMCVDAPEFVPRWKRPALAKVEPADVPEASTPPTMSSTPATTEVESSVGPRRDENEKRLRQLRKKLQQIAKLREKDELSLDPEALEKIASEPIILKEVAALERGEDVDSSDEGKPVEQDATASDAKTRCSPPSSPSHGPQARRTPASSPHICQRGRCLSSSSWYDDEEAAVAVEDVMPADPEIEAANPMTDEPEYLADVKPHSPEARDNPAIASLLMQVRQLSDDCFSEDCLLDCSKRAGWRVTLLATNIQGGADAVLLGFIVFRIKPQLHCVSVAKIAVPEAYRKRGFGRRLVKWAIDYTKALPDINHCSLASLPEAVNFYKRLGFKKMHEITAKTAEEEEDLFPGQIYMELRTRKLKPMQKKR